ncbi:hypothetical protein MTR67_045788 [Solanum verrucosum]|uniref:Uncharacterized protein n=1 Tax=Solanum verrucosum TaxID=315347 RepID=A0AAF0USX9_SOLVR|nr:hypothetical protein MTR67_045788 [Solanum verrucosum]
MIFELTCCLNPTRETNHVFLWLITTIQNVEYAHELLVIETLLITEEMWENNDINLRKKYSKLKNLVQETGEKGVQFSGDRLAEMTRIAAILRFPIPNIDDLVW